MTNVSWYVLGLAIFFAVAIRRPTSARIPEGTWLPEGVQPDGTFVVRPVPLGGDHRDARGILHDDSVQPPGKLTSKIYCTGGTRPVIAGDGRTLGCQRPVAGWP